MQSCQSPYGAFLSLLPFSRKQMQQLFRRADRNGDGNVSLGELNKRKQSLSRQLQNLAISTPEGFQRLFKLVQEMAVIETLMANFSEYAGRSGNRYGINSEEADQFYDEQIPNGYDDQDEDDPLAQYPDLSRFQLDYTDPRLDTLFRTEPQAQVRTVTATKAENGEKKTVSVTNESKTVTV